MTAKTLPSNALRQRHRLHVDRTDIHFHTVAPDRVRIRIEVHNLGDGPSPPTTLRLQAAVLGAFVPWSPLTTLRVPPIQAGRSVTVETEVRRPRTEAVADFSGFVPRTLTTATSGGEDGEPDDPAVVAASERAGREGVAPSIVDAIRSRMELALLRQRAIQELPDDLLALWECESSHWAGNMEVLIEGEEPVERHEAKDLRFVPGRHNLVEFALGRGSYTLWIEGTGASWPIELRDMFDEASFHQLGSRFHVEVESDYTEVMLDVHPPEDCERGTVNVHVQREMDGAQAIVEFGMDAHAAGPGCYVV